MIASLDWGWIVLSLGVGLLLGFLYYGGLWLTVLRLRSADRPGLLLLSSFLVRIALLIPLLLWLADSRFDRLVAALLGFLIMRQYLTRRLGRVEITNNRDAD